MNNIQNSKTLTNDQKSKLQVPTAFWVESFNAIQNFRTVLQKATLQADSNPVKIVTVSYVHYNLPNRDCNAQASSG